MDAKNFEDLLTSGESSPEILNELVNYLDALEPSVFGRFKTFLDLSIQSRENLKNKARAPKLSPLAMSLKVGTRVRYTGDVCNLPGKGSIIKVQNTRWGTQLLIRLDPEGDQTKPDTSIAEREFWITPNSFLPGPGCRFFVMEETK